MVEICATLLFFYYSLRMRKCSRNPWKIYLIQSKHKNYCYQHHEQCLFVLQIINFIVSFLCAFLIFYEMLSFARLMTLQATIFHIFPLSNEQTFVYHLNKYNFMQAARQCISSLLLLPIILLLYYMNLKITLYCHNFIDFFQFSKTVSLYFLFLK